MSTSLVYIYIPPPKNGVDKALCDRPETGVVTYPGSLDGLLWLLVAQLLEGVVVVALALRQEGVQVAALILHKTV